MQTIKLGMDIKVGIIGDLIIDKFKYFKSVRLSPEGPAPVVKEEGRALCAGGAGNLATSISNLSLKTNFYFALSNGESSSIKKNINEVFKEIDISLNPINTSEALKIPLKVRYYVDSHYFMREDIENSFNYEDSILKDSLIDEILSENDVLVISDYQKGTVDTESLKKIIAKSISAKKPFFIDTKNKNKEAIKNAYCLKINKSEFQSLFSIKDKNLENDIDQLKSQINLEREKSQIRNLVVTIGSKGSILSNSDGIFHVTSSLVEVIDLTGAGDAYLAALVYSHISKYSKSNSDSLVKNLVSKDIKFANLGAESVVCKKGTAPISKNFVKEQNLKSFNIGFTNGCFDILHIGHISLLKEAKKNCDYLIVGLNSDSSIKKLKGETRPIINQKDRIALLESITYVDEVRVFDQETPMELIKEISPDILIKGEDYKEEEIVGCDYIKSYGGKVLRVKLFPNKSTSNIVKLIKEKS